eukprot:584043-Pyramimonas_sp.AAC.1
MYESNSKKFSPHKYNQRLRPSNPRPKVCVCVCDAASAKFLESVADIAKDLTQKNERTEREVFMVKQRMDKAEVANAELKASVAKLEAIVSEAEARAPSINATSMGTWDREPDPVTFWVGCSVPMVEADILPALANWFRAAAVTGAQIAFHTT